MVSKGIRRIFRAKQKSEQDAKAEAYLDSELDLSESTTGARVAEDLSEVSTHEENKREDEETEELDREDVEENTNNDVEENVEETGLSEDEDNTDGLSMFAELEDSDSDSNLDIVKYKRINTLHAEIEIPSNANSGDEIEIDHDGVKQIKVPKGQSGQVIKVKMIKTPQQPKTGLFCGCF